MARRVLSAGYPLAVWNRSPGPADLLAAEGAARAQSPVEAVRDADVVILMLADAAAVHAVIEQAAPALRAGTVVVDASTIGPEAVAAIRTRLPDGVAYLDAPVMGSVDRATSGQLGVLVGGDAEPVLPLLRLFGTVTSTGPVGTAAALKIVLITAVVTGVAAVAEAMALADRFGLPEDLVKSALAASPIAGVAGRAFATAARFPVRLAAKDVAIALASLDLPVYHAVHEVLTEYAEGAEQDLGQIVSHVRDLTRTSMP